MQEHVSSRQLAYGNPIHCSLKEHDWFKARFPIQTVNWFSYAIVINLLNLYNCNFYVSAKCVKYIEQFIKHNFFLFFF